MNSKAPPAGDELQTRVELRTSLGVKLGFEVPSLASGQVQGGADLTFYLDGTFKQRGQTFDKAMIAARPPMRWKLYHAHTAWYVMGELKLETPLVKPRVRFWMAPAKGCEVFDAKDTMLRCVTRGRIGAVRHGGRNGL